ncbi:DUF1674 domain-containing protein [Mesorhizobium sp. LHD-90]|uniref:DUF1674 domain-containing protein n=1 Tax=Mesorhizobium sp. LHD-90 TaxID=3071414 RepID=UPI0027E18992|nr:DUF1674 domain-containing protein [Mesorhizobium sp. LHD-90]MDQ6437118.1 DUF1674 domain-containing protein [Mesorhizobium sp. LHD-90]
MISDETAPADPKYPEGGATPGPEAARPTKPLAPAARRALEEAAERRGETEARVKSMPREVGGRGGEEPVRYGDWEIKGIASDF